MGFRGDSIRGEIGRLRGLAGAEKGRFPCHQNVTKCFCPAFHTGLYSFGTPLTGGVLFCFQDRDGEKLTAWHTMSNERGRICNPCARERPLDKPNQNVLFYRSTARKSLPDEAVQRVLHRLLADGLS